MIDKSINNINCPTYRAKLLEANEIHLFSDRSQVLNDTHYQNGTIIFDETIISEYTNDTDDIPAVKNKTILFDITKLEGEVCQAEIDSQILDSKLNVYTAPFDTVFGIIMILFAGGWSDKNGRRKPCMVKTEI